ncbi:MAG: dihydrofolate reductase [Lachnospiraceae bacterium]|nr:dihydrofolate reductase [Lachnospiraceae bacterium]
MKAIVAVDRNWAIGNGGRLLVSIPADHKMFRNETMGKVVIYGRKTLETFPMARPLEGRENIILSGNRDLKVKGAAIAHSMDELFEKLEAYDTDDVYVIGGDSVYRQLVPYCNMVHVTRIDYEYKADAFFPNLDKDPAWHRTGESEEQTYFDLTYAFLLYEKYETTAGGLNP